MLRGRDVDEVIELKRQGVSIRAISRLTGYHRATIVRYLQAPSARPVYGPRVPTVSKLEPFKDYLRERLCAGVWNAVVLLRELRERGYEGSYTLLTDWLRPQRQQAESVAVQRFETPPGKQAQVDWGHLGSLSEGDRELQLWGFTMTLGYSRRMFAAAATDQKLGTLLRMHEAAFYEWSAVPDEILYDRMKTVWTGVDERGEIVWNAPSSWTLPVTGASRRGAPTKLYRNPKGDPIISRINAQALLAKSEQARIEERELRSQLQAHLEFCQMCREDMNW